MSRTTACVQIAYQIHSRQQIASLVRTWHFHADQPRGAGGKWISSGIHGNDLVLHDPAHPPFSQAEWQAAADHRNRMWTRISGGHNPTYRALIGEHNYFLKAADQEEIQKELWVRKVAQAAGFTDIVPPAWTMDHQGTTYLVTPYLEYGMPIGRVDAASLRAIPADQVARIVLFNHAVTQDDVASSGNVMYDPVRNHLYSIDFGHIGMSALDRPHGYIDHLLRTWTEATTGKTDLAAQGKLRFAPEDIGKLANTLGMALHDPLLPRDARYTIQQRITALTELETTSRPTYRQLRRAIARIEHWSPTTDQGEPTP